MLFKTVDIQNQRKHIVLVIILKENEINILQNKLKMKYISKIK